MCVNIEVIMPKLKKFLLIHSLRCGAILVFFWTVFRALFCIILFSTAILETLVGKESPFGPWLVSSKPETDDTYFLYYFLSLLMISQTVLFIFVMYLGMGLFRCDKVHLIQHYLVFRFFVLLIEVSCLLTLSFTHKILIGWYLGVLFFVFLELYSFVVVYSYYVDMTE